MNGRRIKVWAAALGAYVSAMAALWAAYWVLRALIEAQ